MAATRPKQRCMALTKAGSPCRAWATAGSGARSGRPLCRAHAAAAQPMNVTAPKGMVVPEGSRAGASGLRQLYGIPFDEEEVAALEALATGRSGADSLAAEVELARVVLRRLLARMGEPGALLETAPAVLLATRTVARLLRQRQALGASGDEQGRIMDEALDIVSEKLGVDL